MTASITKNALRGDRHLLLTGSYAQLRGDWTISHNVTASVEGVHFQVADSIRKIGGENSNYIGVELKFGW